MAQAVLTALQRLPLEEERGATESQPDGVQDQQVVAEVAPVGEELAATELHPGGDQQVAAEVAHVGEVDAPTSSGEAVGDDTIGTPSQRARARDIF